jgi:CxxC motif-containing protein (DUF1111 family)
VAGGSSANPSPALSTQPVNLFSDLLVHHMGQGLADGITQGPPGRTRDLMAAIEAHSGQGSEANAVIQRFKGLNTGQQQDVLNFLRAL